MRGRGPKKPELPARRPEPHTVVVVDPDGEVFECRDGNNRGEIPASSCIF